GIAGVAVIGTNGSGFLSWLMTLARHKVLDDVKREQRLKRGGTERHDAGGTPGKTGAGRDSGPLGEVADGGSDPGVLAERAEAREHLLRVLEELPEEYRRVLEMRYLGGAEYDVIRAALGMTDGALRGI